MQNNMHNFFGNYFQKTKISLSRFRAFSYWADVADFPIHIAYKNLNCLFIHIPKTAGLSVSNSLFGSNSQHCSILQYRYIFGNSYVDNAFKFAFVRHPIDRFISASTFLLKGGINHSDLNFRNKYLQGINTFDQIIDVLDTSEIARNYYHFLPQVHWLTDFNGSYNFDILGRMENLDNDFHMVCKHLGVDCSLPLLNQTGVKNRIFPISSRVRNWICNYYHDDFTAFKYSTDLF